MLTIPCPPSVNKLYRNVPGRGRAPTRDYRNWLAEAGWLVREQLPDRVPGRVVISICVERACLASDLDNRIKAILDLLVKQHVIDDDRWVVGLLAAWAPPANKHRPKARVLITPAASLTAQFHLTPDGATGGWFIDALEQEEAA